MLAQIWTVLQILPHFAIIQGAIPTQAIQGRAVQVVGTDMSPAQTAVQTEFQKYTFAPVNQAQIMHLIIFIFMFFAAIGFYLWYLKPLFRLLDQV